MMNKPFFEVIYRSKKSRACVGRLHTPHGTIDTPNFVPVGTHGALKGVDAIMAQQLDVQLLFCNTYHLLVQPGVAVIKEAGGLHAFMHRDKPIFTDSGGFQVFSLMYGGVAQELKSQGNKISCGGVIKITEEGVLFRSYRDGSPLLLTPELSIAAQKILGADLIVAFDELPPYHVERKKLLQALHRTHRWEERSLAEHTKDPHGQALYAIIHGGIDQELRRLSVEHLAQFPFDGFAIGGSVGKNRSEMLDMLSFVMPRVPEDRPNHLLGVADIESIDACIPLGVNTFDSAYPTKCARHGLILTMEGRRKITTNEAAHDHGPLEAGCHCYTCRNYSAAYVCHLFRAHELSAYTLATMHNVHVMMEIMRRYRERILNGDI